MFPIQAGCDYPHIGKILQSRESLFTRPSRVKYGVFHTHSDMNRT